MLKKVAISVFGVMLALSSAHAEDTFNFDLDHSTIGFSVRHMGITNVRGLFSEYEGHVTMENDDPETLHVHAVIQAKSIDTNNQRRDDHLRNPDFFEVEAFPTLTFTSTGVEREGEGHVIVGHMTIKDVTREVRFPVTVSGPAEDPWGNTRIGVEITGTLERHDYGVGFDGASDRLIGDTVTLDVNLQAIKQ